MFFAVILFVAFGVGVVAIVVGLTIVLVNRLRGRRSEDWRDDPAESDVRVRPGPGWGNGGTWN